MKKYTFPKKIGKFLERRFGISPHFDYIDCNKGKDRIRLHIEYDKQEEEYSYRNLILGGCQFNTEPCNCEYDCCGCEMVSGSRNYMLFGFILFSTARIARNY